MAFKLTKEEKKLFDETVEKLSEIEGRLDGAVNDYNDAVSEARDKLQGVVDEYNGMVQEAQSVLESVNERAQGEYDEKSEKWQEGDNGCDASNWIEEWGIRLEEVELDDIDEVSLDLETLATLESLPQEAGG